MTDSMRDRFVTVATQLLDEDPRIAVVMADISVDRFRSSGARARHPLRVINVGIREQLMVDVAAGMALEGMRPIVHTFAPFLVERAFEQVKLGFSHQGVGGILVSAGASYDVAAYGADAPGAGGRRARRDAPRLAHRRAGARGRGGSGAACRRGQRRGGVHPPFRQEQQDGSVGRETR